MLSLARLQDMSEQLGAGARKQRYLVTQDENRAGGVPLPGGRHLRLATYQRLDEGSQW